MAAKEVFVNYHNCNPFLGSSACINPCKNTGTQVKKNNCQGTLTKFIRSRGWSRKKYFRLRNTGYKKGL